MALEYLIPVLFLSEETTNCHGLSTRHYQETSITNAAVWLWSPEEAARFAAMAIYTPDLLTIEEERVWFAVMEKPYFGSSLTRKKIAMIVLLLKNICFLSSVRG